MLWQMQCSGNVQSLYILLQICIYDNTTTKLVLYTVFTFQILYSFCEKDQITAFNYIDD